VAAHDTLLVLLRPAVAVPSHARGQTYPTQQNKQRIVRGYSWQLPSVQIGLDEETRLPRLHKLLSLRATCAGAIARRVARQLV